MRLSELLARAEVASSRLVSDPDITGLTSDSRLVEPGHLFAALPGTARDGEDYIDNAADKGAVVMLRNGTGQISVDSIKPDASRHTSIYVPNPQLTLAKLAAVFYQPAPDNLVAVTGTNGKTSVVHFAQQLWQGTGVKAGSIGTLGLHGDGLHEPGRLTTPDAVALHQGLRKMAGLGITHVALEASSHGLDQHRMDGLELKAGGFTYLGRDHLDYHATPENYLAAKTRLFSRLLPTGATAVLNADVPEFERLTAIATERKLRVMSYGRQGHDFRLHNATPSPDGLRLELAILGQRVEVQLPITGGFQAHNVLCALGLVIGSGLASATAVAALPKLHNVAGRMQRVATSRQGAPIYVDYAHTPDALETVLAALRPHARGRLVVVFGCGGNRDRTKRPLMGTIATRLADKVFVTDDNPRLEEPGLIRSEIMAAAPAATEVGDRAEAIARAIATLGPEDVLLIAGKGHEQGQIIGAELRPFDDAAVARACVKELTE